MIQLQQIAQLGKRRNTMTVDQLRAAYEMQPFRPFIIHLADGREIAVPSREFIYLLPFGRTIIVAQPDGTFSIVDLLLVTEVEFKPINGVGKRRRA